MSISGINGYSWSPQATLRAQNRQNLPAPATDYPPMAADIASTAPASAAIAISPSNGNDDAIKQFMDYVNQPLAQRLEEAWLAQHGITKKQFDAMSTEDKQKLVAKMKQEIEAKMKDASSTPHKPVNILA